MKLERKRRKVVGLKVITPKENAKTLKKNPTI